MRRFERDAAGPVAGVCGGIARAFGWDAGVVRVVCAALAVVSCGLLAVVYVALWVAWPRASQAGAVVDVQPEGARRRMQLPARKDVGAFAVMTAVLMAASLAMAAVLTKLIDGFELGCFWALLAIGAGAVRLVTVRTDAGGALPAVVEGAGAFLVGAIVLLDGVGLIELHVIDWMRTAWPLLLASVVLAEAGRLGRLPVLAAVAAAGVVAFCMVGLAGFAAPSDDRPLPLEPRRLAAPVAAIAQIDRTQCPF